MKKIRKILSALLALVMALSCFAVMGVTAAPATDKTGVDIYDGTIDQTAVSRWDDAINADLREYTINTADELMQFAKLTNSNSFKGWTIKLGKDIVINTGDASKWNKSTTGLEPWDCSNNWNNAFDGNFDGQGHVISGLYATDANGNHKEIGLFGFMRPTADRSISNVSIINSYFGYDSKAGGVIGSIDPVNACTVSISGVYVNANVEASVTGMAGGLIGYVNNGAAITVKINDCAFDGTVLSKNKAGGAIGELCSKGHTVTVENYKVDADITITDERAGGIIGSTENSTVTLKTCDLNVRIVANLAASNTWGAKSGLLMGVMKNANTLTVNDCMVQGSLSDKNQRSSGLLGYIMNYGNINVKMNNVLVAVNGSSVNSIVAFCNEVNNTTNLKLELSNIKYDSTVLNKADAKTIHMGAAANATGADFIAEGVATDGLKGVSVFDGWKAVEGDYPTPVSDTANEAIPCIDNKVAYQNYGKPAAIYGYQHSYDNDVVKNEDDSYKLRLIATMNGENYKAAGFKNISVIYKDANGAQVGETFTLEVYYCNYIYESVKGGNETYTADGYLCDNIFCLTIGNIPANVAKMEVTATSFVAESAETVIDGEVASFTVNVY